MEAQIVRFERYGDQRGVLVVAECGGGEAVPFQVKRVFWIVEPRGQRGGHSHKNCQQVIAALAGSCRAVTDGVSRRLHDPAWGLFVPCGVNVDLEDFAPGTVLLVLCSEHFDQEDYVAAKCACDTCTCTAQDAEVIVCAS